MGKYQKKRRPNPRFALINGEKCIALTYMICKKCKVNVKVQDFIIVKTEGDKTWMACPYCGNIEEGEDIYDEGTPIYE
jgi:hypothetical protein